MKFAFIEAEKLRVGAPRLCRLLGVSRSGFYAWRKRGTSARAQRDLGLKVKVAAIHRESGGTYGSPRITDELQAAGEDVGRRRVARLMRESELSGQFKRRWRMPAPAPGEGPYQPNVLDREFAVSAPDRVWAADITYVKTWEGWLYLAVVIDLFSRRVVGFALRDNLRTDVVLAALTTAVGRRMPTQPVLHHSDRGCQYTSDDYRKLLRGLGLTCSMSNAGDCYDNAVVESFFATLKKELIHRRAWATRDEVSRAIEAWIDGWYNPRRRHSHLGHLSPAEYERRYHQSETQVA